MVYKTIRVIKIAADAEVVVRAESVKSLFKLSDHLCTCLSVIVISSVITGSSTTAFTQDPQIKSLVGVLTR